MMKQRTTSLRKYIFVATCVALVGTGVGALGCGDDGGPAGATVDSDLFGIYQITQFQLSPTDCNAAEDATPPAPYLVLYSYNPGGDLDEAWLGGGFCEDVAGCRTVAQAGIAPPIGYSFLSGDDASGWLGFAVPTGGPAGDQCRADVQAHTMMSPSADTIHVDTKTSQVIYAPTIDGMTATCSTRDALEAWNEDLPCEAIIVLDATYETTL